MHPYLPLHDHPILSPEADKLDRGPFVDSLVRSLVTDLLDDKGKVPLLSTPQMSSIFATVPKPLINSAGSFSLFTLTTIDSALSSRARTKMRRSSSSSFF